MTATKVFDRLPTRNAEPGPMMPPSGPSVTWTVAEWASHGAPSMMA